MFKKLLLDLRKTIYLLFAICTFSVIGSLIIYFNPEGYFKIHIYPLFQWLIEHPRLDTFWIYIIISLFLYIALATIFCLINDYKRRDLLVAIMHFSVLLFLAAHIVSALFTFRINDQIFIENTESKILIKEHQKVLNIRVKKIIYEISQFGIPVNIKAQIELPNGSLKEIMINHPITVDRYHLILKDLTGFLSEIEVSVIENKESRRLLLKPNLPVKFNDVFLTLLDISEDFSTIKLKLEDNKNSSIELIKTGNHIIINNKQFLVQNITPKLNTAIIVDVVYDPSLFLILISSSLFSMALVIQFVIKFKKMLHK